jgi:hypothetical protein
MRATRNSSQGTGAHASPRMHPRLPLYAGRGCHFLHAIAALTSAFTNGRYPGGTRGRCKWYYGCLGREGGWASGVDLHVFALWRRLMGDGIAHLASVNPPPVFARLDRIALPSHSQFPSENMALLLPKKNYPDHSVSPSCWPCFHSTATPALNTSLKKRDKYPISDCLWNS